MILPPHCYSNKDRNAEGLVIHYFSCIYADPERWDDPQRCWELFFDLNLPRDARQNSWLTPLGNDRNYASADWMITPQGERIDLVPYGKKTWHAGKSAYRGRENCNNFMAGVELIAAPQVKAEYDFTEAQYKAVAELILDYNFLPKVTTHEAIRDEYLIMHPEDKHTPVKKDPGPSWDWGRLREYLNIDLDGG